MRDSLVGEKERRKDAEEMVQSQVETSQADRRGRNVKTIVLVAFC
jgi:hypothetical protein